MKKMCSIGLVVGLMMLSSVGMASESYYVTLDQYTITSTGNITISPEYSLNKKTVMVLKQYDFPNGYYDFSYNDAFGQNNLSVANSYGSASVINGNKSANISVYPGDGNVIAAYATDYSTFKIYGTGEITFSANYTYSNSVSNERNRNIINMSLTSIPIQTSSNSTSAQLFGYAGIDENNGTGAGTLSFTYKIDNVTNEYFRLNSESAINMYGKITSVSPVPIPGSALLLGSGLVGLTGLRRKKKE